MGHHTCTHLFDACISAQIGLMWAIVEVTGGRVLSARRDIGHIYESGTPQSSIMHCPFFVVATPGKLVLGHRHSWGASSDALDS